MLLDKRKVGFVTKIGAVVLAVVFVAMYVPLLFQPDTPTKQLSQQEQMDNMIESLKLTAENSPKDVNAWLQLADVYYAQNKIEEAAKTYEKAVAIDPKNIKTHFGLSAAAYGLGQVETATAEIQKVIEIDPKYAQSYFNLGVYQTGAGKVEEAIKSYEKYIELEPKGAQVKDAKDQIAQLKKAGENTASAFETAGSPAGSKAEGDTEQQMIEQAAESLKNKSLMGGSDPTDSKSNDSNDAGSFISIGADAGKDPSNPHQ